MTRDSLPGVVEAVRFQSVRKRVRLCYALHAPRTRSVCSPERRGIIQPRAKPWEYRHHGSQALKGRNKATFSAPKSATRPTRGNALSPFQGSGCFNVYPQGVAPGYIIAAFQAGHAGASKMRVECSVDGRTLAELPSAVASIRNTPGQRTMLWLSLTETGKLLRETLGAPEERPAAKPMI